MIEPDDLVPITADFRPFDSDSYRADVMAAIADIEESGVKVLSVHLSAVDSPAKYAIVFPAEEPQWRVREKLEKKLYDVGSNLGRNSLSFYATKRTQNSRGWST